MIIAEGGLKNNVDIHLEEISRYPKEEVLFLPFCNFKIKSFEKVNENNLSYYRLVTLISGASLPIHIRRSRVRILRRCQ